MLVHAAMLHARRFLQQRLIDLIETQHAVFLGQTRLLVGEGRQRCPMAP